MIIVNKDKIKDMMRILYFLYERILNNPFVHIILILLGISGALYYLYTFEPLTREITEIIKIPQNNLYVIDSGHGHNPKNDCNWKSVKDENGCFYEYEFNRDVVTHLCALLDNAGIFYIRTDTLVDQRDMSITDRVRLVNNLKRALDKKKIVNNNRSLVLFSIHGNAASNTKANGIEVFTSIKKCKKYENKEMCEDNMHQLATLLSDNLKLVFPNKVFRDTPEAEYKETSLSRDGEITLLDKTDSYAVLSENGFYTNPVEREEMKSNEYKIKVAMAHYKTICALEKINP